MVLRNLRWMMVAMMQTPTHPPFSWRAATIRVLDLGCEAWTDEAWTVAFTLAVQAHGRVQVWFPHLESVCLWRVLMVDGRWPVSR